MTISPSAGETITFFLFGGILSGSRKKLKQNNKKAILKMRIGYFIHGLCMKIDKIMKATENPAQKRNVFKPYLVIIQ